MAELCQIGDERQLLEEVISVNVPAGTTVSNSYTLTTNRGNVQGVSITSSFTASDFLTILNVLINSTNVLKNLNAGDFTPQSQMQIFPVRWENGSIVSYTYVNSGVTDVIIVLKFYYVLPLIY